MISLKPENVTSVILACCSLHNYLMKKSTCYAPPGSMDMEVNGNLYVGSWRNEVDLSWSHCQNVGKGARKMLRKWETWYVIMSMAQVPFHGNGKCWFLELIWTINWQSFILKYISLFWCLSMPTSIYACAHSICFDYVIHFITSYI